ELAPALLQQPVELRDARLRAGGIEIVAVPALPEIGDSLESRVALAAEVDRRVRLLDRLGKLPAARQPVELALVLGDGVAPQRLHDIDVFAAAHATAVERDAEHVELFLQPTNTD